VVASVVLVLFSITPLDGVTASLWPWTGRCHRPFPNASKRLTAVLSRNQTPPSESKPPTAALVPKTPIGS